MWYRDGIIFFMAEQERKTSAEWVWEAPRDALSEVIQKLNISPETEKEIQTLSQDEKEELQVLFARIWKEVETQKLWPTDKERKIKNTLAEKYWIIIRNNKVTNTQGNIETVTWKTSIESVNHKILSEKLDAVKDLDQKVVSDELRKAKAEKPILPEETKLAIAKATNTDPSQIDEAIKKGDNPQIQNLVDTYYLTNAKVQSAIESRLPEEEKWKSYVAFQELRWSAREFWVLSSFTPTDLPSRLSDKSDKTQQEVISTFNSINKDNPNTLITRTGDKLNWEGTNGKKYEIDMGQRPPKLSKKNGILEVEQDIHDTKEMEAQANTKREYKEVQGKNLIFCQNIANNYTPNIQESIAKAEEKTQISPSEIRELMNTLQSQAKSTETKQTACQRLIEIYGYAETLPEFQAKMDAEALSVGTGLRDYFYSARVQLETLRKWFENEMSLKGKLPEKSKEELVSVAEFEDNTNYNLDMLGRLGFKSFKNMDEVVGFFQSQNWSGSGNKWSDREDINRFLWSEKLRESQMKELLNGLAKVHDNIRTDKTSELENKQKVDELNRDEWNGETKLGNSLEKYRIERWGWILRKSDFEQLLSQTGELKESPKEKSEPTP